MNKAYSHKKIMHKIISTLHKNMPAKFAGGLKEIAKANSVGKKKSDSSNHISNNNTENNLLHY
jgi:hypothetical protein